MTRNEFFEALANGAKWDVGVSIARTNPLPLDANSVFESVEALETYIRTNPLAYPGQLVSVIGETELSAYHVTSVGENCAYIKLAESTVSEDIAADVAALQGKVSDLTSDLDDLKAVVGIDADSGLRKSVSDNTDAITAVEGRLDTLESNKKVFVLEWSNGRDANGVEHPTEAEKQTIVDTIAEINTMEVGTYEVLLHLFHARYLPFITYEPPALLVFRDDIDSNEPMRYEIYAPSVELYSQEKSRYVEDSYYDKNGLHPATMQLTAQYINEQITNSVGEVAEGKTVVEMIEDAQIAATYDDTQVKADIQANVDAIDAIKSDYLKAADKTELQDQITTNSNAITVLTEGVDPDKIDGVKDLVDWVDTHGAEVNTIKEDILANTTAITNEKERAESVEQGLDSRLTITEGNITTLTGDETTDGSVKKQINDTATTINTSISSLSETVTSNKLAAEAGIEEAKSAASTADHKATDALTAAGVAQSTANQAVADAKTANDAIAVLNGDGEGSVANSIDSSISYPQIVNSTQDLILAEDKLSSLTGLNYSLQGMCSDGTHVYYAIRCAGSIDDNAYPCILRKALLTTGEVVQYIPYNATYGIHLGHGNDMAYYPTEDLIFTAPLYDSGIKARNPDGSKTSTVSTGLYMHSADLSTMYNPGTWATRTDEEFFKDSTDSHFLKSYDWMINQYVEIPENVFGFSDYVESIGGLKYEDGTDATYTFIRAVAYDKVHDLFIVVMGGDRVYRTDGTNVKLCAYLRFNYGTEPKSSSFTHVKTFEIRDFNETAGGIETDGEYIYQTFYTPGHNYIAVYTADGSFLYTYDIDPVGELEAICRLSSSSFLVDYAGGTSVGENVRDVVIKKLDITSTLKTSKYLTEDRVDRKISQSDGEIRSYIDTEISQSSIEIKSYVNEEISKIPTGGASSADQVSFNSSSTVTSGSNVQEIIDAIDNFCGYPLKGKTLLVVGDSYFFGSGLSDENLSISQSTNLLIRSLTPASSTVLDLIARKYGMTIYKDVIPGSTLAGNCTSIPDLNGGTVGFYSIAKRYSEICDGQTVNVYSSGAWTSYDCQNTFKAYGDATEETKYKMFSRAGDYEIAQYSTYATDLVDTSSVVPDYIVINGGANDLNKRFGSSGKAYIKIGENTDTDIKTFKGAINTIITGVKTKFPKAKLLFMTPFRGTDGNAPKEDSGYCREDFVNAMLEVCALRGIPCLDWFRNSGIDLSDDNQKAWAETGTVYGRSPGHYTEEAHQWVMPQMEAFLKGYTTSNVIPSLYIDSEVTV